MVESANLISKVRLCALNIKIQSCKLIKLDSTSYNTKFVCSLVRTVTYIWDRICSVCLYKNRYIYLYPLSLKITFQHVRGASREHLKFTETVRKPSQGLCVLFHFDGVWAMGPFSCSLLTLCNILAVLTCYLLVIYLYGILFSNYVIY